ncbi:MAG: AAA family ATPase [Planctomycetes bacterium]|nr:AAA family ATPase [Planctomycetota bacterium]
MTPEELAQASARCKSIVERIGSVFVGDSVLLEKVLAAALADGHVLFEDYPGLGKTLLVKVCARVIGCDYKRVQFTPDQLPSDIIGTNVWRQQDGKFDLIKGPVFTNILLADEINRTPPKTQAALLEAMQEYRVTASGNTYELSLPFFVLATQNPLEQEGTYPLPEAQLDRFMFNIWVDYPEEKEEEAIVKQTTRDIEMSVHKIMGTDEILRLQEIVRRVPVSSHVVKYATSLVRASRPSPENPLEFINDWVHCGAGPRACQYLILGAKARAVIDGRCNVSCADVKESALPVLRHRIYTNFNADSEGVGAVEIVGKLMESVPEPTEEDYRKRRLAERTQPRSARQAAPQAPIQTAAETTDREDEARPAPSRLSDQSK